MSSIFKLSVSGIRAFDNHDRETIQFGTPLTLIAGPNGVGKTTIIEALKYATTGDLPPNSKNGAFIHDPKISGEKEVLAQVKLAYYNTNGNQMVCTRSMRLTVKKTQQSFKTLEGQLLIMSDGQRETISSRCADLDTQVPLSLGMSAAVLNYVVFCHQEDSLWPLSEPSVVKKRFDEIFEATKFTKALETLKVLRKEYTQDTKVQEKTVQYLKQDNERANKKTEKMVELKDKISTYNDECAELKTSMGATVKKLNDLFEQNQKFQQVIYELKQARKSQADVEQTIATTESGLELLDLSLDELKAQLEGFDEQNQAAEAHLTEVSGIISKKTSELGGLRTSLSNLNHQSGMIQAEHQTYERQKTNLSELASQWVKELDLNAAGNSIDNLLEVLQSKSDDVSAQYKSLQLEHQQIQSAMEQELNAVTANKFQVEHNIHTNKETVRKNEIDIKSLEAEIKAVTKSSEAGNIKYQQAVLEEISAQVAGYEKDLADFNASNEIQLAQQRVLELQAKVEAGNRELVKATDFFKDHSKLAVLKDNVLKKQFHLDSLLSAESARFKSAIGCDLKIETLEADFNRVQDSLKSDLAVSQRSSNEAQLKQGDIKARLEVANQELATMEQTATELKTEIEQALPSGALLSDFDRNLTEVEEDVEVAVQNMEQSSFTSQYYDAAKNVATKNHNCLLCQHKFTSNELDIFLELLKQKTESIPLTKEDAVAALEEARNEFEKLRALAPSVSRYTSITDGEIPAVKQKIQELEKQKSDIESVVKSNSKSVTDLQKQISVLADLFKDLQEIMRVSNDISSLQLEIEETSKSIGTGSSQIETPERLQSILNESTVSLRTAESNVSNLRDRHSAMKDRLSKAHQDLSRRQLEIKNLELQDQASQVKTAKINELRRDIEDISNQLPKLESENDELAAKIAQAQERFKDAKIQAASKEKVVAESLNKIQQAINKHAGIARELQIFEAKYSDGTLAKLEADMQRLQSSIASYESEIGELEAKSKSLDRKLVDARGQKRVLQDNLQLRTSKQALEDLKLVIKDLESHDAERDKEKYENDTNTLQSMVSELNSEHATKLGEIKQMEEQVNQLETELSTEYKDVLLNYRRACAKLDSTVAATEDLNTYSQALDAAIMTYHSLKMEEINRVLDELWKKTYTGTDIDTISIKSETEARGARGTYNYRVCMVKQDTELDMRGRCSAGQKVLASVVIRLALSECFGINNGLIVLDEPTTNLDHSNIESLAKSLANIIEVRRAQRNFQLIIITHDEHFLTAMNPSSYTDHFYRIGRDSRQMSRIERIPINQLVN